MQQILFEAVFNKASKIKDILSQKLPGVKMTINKNIKMCFIYICKY